MENSITNAIRALETHYEEYGENRSLEYTYGFMDAMAVLREMETRLGPQVGKKTTGKPAGNIRNT